MQEQEFVQVQLRAMGELQSFTTSGIKFDVGSKVIVESDRGLEHGVVVSLPEKIPTNTAGRSQPLRKIIRAANPWDEAQILKNKAKTKELIKICEKKVAERGLSMKLVDAEYSFDRAKIIFYFTSESRVDFRDLVKDLASIFRVRIELRQIGVRDEAKMLGGIGPCGRKLCCISFLKDFNPVTIKMAKVQNLSLKPSKISGICGRLMCCLGYEHECYKECSKCLPKIGKEIRTPQGKGRVISTSPLKGTVTVDLGEGGIKEIKVQGLTEEK
ncbi:MAG: stage 0 sporulation family protein [Candidatus Omnitrophota bacterium]